MYLCSPLYLIECTHFAHHLRPLRRCTQFIESRSYITVVTLYGMFVIYSFFVINLYWIHKLRDIIYFAQWFVIYLSSRPFLYLFIHDVSTIIRVIIIFREQLINNSFSHCFYADSLYNVHNTREKKYDIFFL